MPSRVPHLLGVLAATIVAAKLCGALAQRLGQPAVLGELIAGVLLGVSVFGLLDPTDHILHVLAEIGVVLLLFEIGLETDLKQLIRVGPASTAVAVVGVILPFAAGYAVCRLLGLTNLPAVVAGATLTATSVGITARVLSDLGRLQDLESKIILGAAVIDDVIGLVILAVVTGMTEGNAVSALSIVTITGAAFGFLIAALVIGRFVVPPVVRLCERIQLPGTLTMMAVAAAFCLAWLAAEAGSAMIIGAFAAGLLLRDTPQAHEIEKGVATLGQFFVPLFFAVVGAGVDLRVLNPLVEANHRTLLIAGALIVVALATKFAAGYSAFWSPARKSVIGAGMIPRGEVGLIFAQMGYSTKLFDAGMFSAATIMVMATTFIAPILLKQLLSAKQKPKTPDDPSGIQELVNEP